MTAVRVSDPAARGPIVRFRVDGRAVTAHAGETLAAALMADGQAALRHSPRAGTARGAFCLMGVCQECVVTVDGVLRQSCLTKVAEGLEVTLGRQPAQADEPTA